MKEISKHALTIDEFYHDIPKLHQKYQNRINTQKKSYCNGISINENIETKFIIVIASKECIDSVVNINALKCIEEYSHIKVKILLKGTELPESYTNDLTPTIYGVNEKLEILWKWVRVPKSISQIENEGPQPTIIVEKLKYRNGLYIKDTLKDIIELINKIAL